ncbi:DUF4249 family protein [Aquimarina sp. MMG016]|uniref:DUF4249 family protein n=1 Tax=Aquimarina sp. MMG016 TaxID=2822690 RepID=UPI001B3A6343|nr:DUF4249 family protein [Aquimarina sp. MMG016]MBQ4821213.1 DUF4249 domain-containing protein [Aquimarina sp. MMG016]
MKKLIYIIFAFIICTGCEDVIEVDIPNGEPRLVIDAFFEKYVFEDPVTVEGRIKLTLTSPFFSNSVPPVSDATVFITNLNDNTVLNFEESSEAGVYIPTTTTFELPETNIDYELTVIHNNETYKATTQLIPTVPIDDIKQGDRVLIDGDETEILITFTDDSTRDDFYLLDFDFNLYGTIEDRFVENDGTFSYFYEDMIAGQDLTVKLLGVDEQFFNYMNIIIEQSDPDSGGPFQVPPASLRGNIINTTNRDNFAFGYFNLSEADRFPFTIEE